MTTVAILAAAFFFAVALWGDAASNGLRWRRVAVELVAFGVSIGLLLIAGCVPAAPSCARSPAPAPRVARVRVAEPCTTPLPPPVPLEEEDPDPHDGAQHDRIICGALEPWDCDGVRRAVWAWYGHRAAMYIEEIRAACAAKEDE